MQLSQLTVVAVDDEQAITYHLKRNLQNHCKISLYLMIPKKHFLI